MGGKKRNWKARLSTTSSVNSSEEKKIKLEIPVRQEEYDDSNALVLPSKKRKSKTLSTNTEKVKVLTKKQKHNLEKIVQRKEKRLQRGELLRQLEMVKASSNELSQMISTADMQSGKLEKKLHPDVGAMKQLSKLSRDVFDDVSYKSYKKIEMKENFRSCDTDVDTSDISTDDEENANNSSNEKVQILGSKMNISKDGDNNDFVCEKSNHENKNLKDIAKDIGSSELRKTVNIPVFRDPEIEVERLRLPVCKEEQWIVETINEHDVVIICGETGSGKTTQIPQFLYEAGYAHNSGIIGITEPRRVAATCIAERVAHEMNLTSQEVSYQIRYEGTAGERTKIKFMTDGVLLKEVQYDFELTKYSAIIIDEAHERSIYSDILIGFLSRIVRLRRKRNNPLKLVIMSATLKVADFKMNTKLFHTPPPVVNIDARQFPVTIHFNRHTPKRDYIEEAFRKVCKIHRKLPDGGILVFVTSQSEVHLLCSKLKKTFPKPVSNFKKMSEVTQTEAVAPFSSSSRLEDVENRMINKNEGSAEVDAHSHDSFSLNDFSSFNKDEDTDDDEVDERDSEDGDDVDESSSDEQAIVSSTSFAKENPDGPMYVLPLYSLLPSDKQALVFKPVPAGFRLCVVATNVAETSITIPNIKYVVDTGKVKTKFYDAVTGVSTFKVTFISQASANQRSGRAGRTGPGHCYRLYSSAVFSDFEEFSEPEIARKPVEDLVLQLKDIGVDRVKNFPFPTPPSAQAIEAAERLLYRLGALEVVPCSIATSKPKEKIYRLTDLGRTLAQFPLNPRYSKMLSLSQQHQLMPYVVALVAALSVQEVFVNSLHHHKMEDENCSDENEAFKKKRLEMQQARLELVGKGEARLLGDNMLLLKVVCLMDANKRKEEWAKLSEKYGIRWKALLEISKMRKQLITLLNTLIPDLNLSNNSTLKFPSQVQAKLLRQIVLSGHVDHIAKRLPDVSGLTLEEARKRKNAYEDMNLVEHVFIHPSSSLFKNKCEYVVYQYIEETSKLYMKGVTSVELEWLPLFAPTDTRFDPVKLDDPDNPPVFDEVDGHVMCNMSGKFGPQFWAVPRITSELPKSIDCLKWFSKFLLEGLVCSKLALFKTFLLTPPSIVVKPWAHLSSRISNLLQALRDKNVHNRKALLDEWKKDPKFLLKEYSAWLPDSQHAVVASIWPPTS